MGITVLDSNSNTRLPIYSISKWVRYNFTWTIPINPFTLLKTLTWHSLSFSKPLPSLPPPSLLHLLFFSPTPTARSHGGNLMIFSIFLFLFSSLSPSSPYSSSPLLNARSLPSTFGSSDAAHEPALQCPSCIINEWKCCSRLRLCVGLTKVEHIFLPHYIMKGYLQLVWSKQQCTHYLLFPSFRAKFG